jgi:hypothetical protein
MADNSDKQSGGSANGLLFHTDKKSKPGELVLELSTFPIKHNEGYMNLIGTWGENCLSKITSYSTDFSPLESVYGEDTCKRFEKEKWAIIGVNVSSYAISADGRKCPSLLFYPNKGSIMVHLARGKTGGIYESIKKWDVVTNLKSEVINDSSIYTSAHPAPTTIGEVMDIMQSRYEPPRKLTTYDFTYSSVGYMHAMGNIDNDDIILIPTIQEAVEPVNRQPIIFKRGLKWCIRKLLLITKLEYLTQ